MNGLQPTPVQIAAAENALETLQGEKRLSTAQWHIFVTFLGVNAARAQQATQETFGFSLRSRQDPGLEMNLMTVAWLSTTHNDDVMRWFRCYDGAASMPQAADGMQLFQTGQIAPLVTQQCCKSSTKS